MGAQEFVERATMAGMLEIAAGKLVSERLVDDRLRDFAQEMVEDHERTMAELKRIAENQGLSVAQRMDRKHRARLAALKKAKGGFRAVYVPMQKHAHEETIRLFERYAAEGQNPALKRFAKSTLPTLLDHHEDIEALAAGAQTTR